MFWPRIKAQMLWRQRVQRASETPQILACLRRLAVRPRQASNRSGDSALIRHESITQGCPVFLFLFAQKCPRAPLI
ncbi:hypothetical protein NBRC111894_2514 [Sporolactobacillus inulinus]|uniref:Uncharacterized protein n=1 Tax=Sporolactobacillus inulinus TaxID=2078 RepID=A0A4Y1ZDB8_9BACL|nr:hypothetical protein NBRC111894_2514 [Sporolactobacillus inulinus]